MRSVSRTRKLLAAIRAGDGAPTALIQNLTGGELQDKNETFISSCKSCGETSFPTGIYAIIGFTDKNNTMHYALASFARGSGIQEFYKRDVVPWTGCR